MQVHTALRFTDILQTETRKQHQQDYLLQTRSSRPSAFMSIISIFNNLIIRVQAVMQTGQANPQTTSETE